MSAEGIIRITMPKWGLSMKEGTVVAWLVNEGAEIGLGIEVVEVETDKIASGIESPARGILRRQIARAGEVAPVGGLLGVIADPEVPDEAIDRFVAEFKATFVPEETELSSSRPAPRLLETPAGNLRYLRRGEGAESALLIHGFGGDLNNWLFNHEALADHRAVYALDLPGHGGSSKRVGEGTLDDLGAAVTIFLDSLGLDRVHLVGHSVGGGVALQFALAHPGRVSSLVLIASTGLGPEIDGAYIDGFVTAARRKEFKPLLEKLFTNPALVSHRLIDDILKYKRLDGVEPALRALANQLFPDGRQARILRDRLAELPIPILVIWGKDDRIIPESHSLGLPEQIRTEVLSHCGHMVQMEASAKVNRLIASFWTTCGSS